MAVLVQEIIQADYAFVIHTTNPSTGDETEIYAEVKLKKKSSTGVTVYLPGFMLQILGHERLIVDLSTLLTYELHIDRERSGGDTCWSIFRPRTQFCSQKVRYKKS